MESGFIVGGLKNSLGELSLHVKSVGRPRGGEYIDMDEEAVCWLVG